MSQIDCPDCNGTGMRATAAQNTSMRDIPCSRCKSSGKVPVIQFEWIRKGKLMRGDRISRDETIREAAARLGVPLIKYVDAEQGRIDPTTLEDVPQ